jgi:hypothetical protein
MHFEISELKRRILQIQVAGIFFISSVHCNMHVLIQKSAITMSIWYDILKLLLTIACFCIIMDCITRSYHRNKQDHRGELICSYHRNKQDHRGELICPTGVHSYMHKAPMTAKYASRPRVCVLLS